MSDFTAVFDRHDLSELFVISPPVRTLTPWEPTSVEAVIGATPTGTKSQPMEITLQLTTFAATLEQRLADLRTLSSWLAVDEPKQLILSDAYIGTLLLTNRYEMRYAWPSGAPKVTQALNATTVEVTFVCPDPRAYEIGEVRPGEEEYYDGRFYYEPTAEGFTTMDLSESDTFTVRGTAPTLPRFDIFGAYGSAQSGKLRIELRKTENSQLLHYFTLDLAHDASSTVRIDMEKRTVTVDNVAVLDMGINWFALEPGVTFTVSLGTAGGFRQLNMVYYPRWW